MMMRNSNFSWHPARLLVIDTVTEVFDVDAWNSLQRALENCLSLFCTIAGPSRVPFLGIVAMKEHPEIIMALQNVRQNLPKYQQALADLHRGLYDQRSKRDSQPLGGASAAVTACLNECIAHYKRQAQNLVQAAGQWYDLELVVVTCGKGEYLAKMVDRALRRQQCQNLKKVHVLCLGNLSTVENESVLNDVILNSQTETETESLHSSHSGVLTDVMHIDPDDVSLENYFKSWLLASNPDQEHVQLTLQISPSGTPIVIKMDVQELIINPLTIPCGQRLGLSVDSAWACMKPQTASSTKSPASKQTSVAQLRAVKRVHLGGVCESVLHSEPYLLKATVCWKLGWDELESNQQQLNALCKLLNDKNEALLVRQFFTKYSSNTTTVPDPCGLFLIVPSDSTSLLIKAIVARELLLPCSVPVSVEPVMADDLALMESALDQIEEVETYNPLDERTGVYEWLLKTHGIKYPQKRGTRPVPPVQPCFTPWTNRRPPSSNTTGIESCPRTGTSFQSAASVLYGQQKKHRSTKTLYNGHNFPKEL